AVWRAPRWGAGRGSLPRQYGLTVDNLLEADLVLADGSFVTASEGNNADLFWALRGGGGNFGVVTSFLFRTSPVKIVYGGPLIFDLADAATVMRWYRDSLPALSEEFYMFLGLQLIPPGDPFPTGEKPPVRSSFRTTDRPPTPRKLSMRSVRGYQSL